MSWVEDRLEILNLIAGYSHAADGNDPEAYADCFTDDGAFVGRVGMPDESRIEGREALLRFSRRAIASRVDGVQNRHVQTNTMIVDQTADQAIARTYLVVMQSVGDKAPFPALTSVYEDEIVKTDKGWRIRVRRAVPDRKGVLPRPSREESRP